MGPTSPAYCENSSSRIDALYLADIPAARTGARMRDSDKKEIDSLVTKLQNDKIQDNAHAENVEAV